MIAAVARVALAVVLLGAGVAKLTDRRRVVGLVAEVLGPRAAAPVAIVLPVVEVGLAVGLLALWGSAIPAWVAAGVIVAFTAVLVRALVRGVACPCFGRLSAARPVGPIDVLRNGALVALAVLASGT